MLNAFRGFRAIVYKEVLHMRRDSMAVVLSLVMPLLQMVILGGAIDTNVRQVPTAVYDQSGLLESGQGGTTETRAFLDRFRNSDTFKIYKYVHSDKELTGEMVAGRARVGIKIPIDFDRELMRGNSAQVMVLVDGSDSSVAGQALNVASSIGLDESLRRILPDGQSLPVDVRPKMMFNPDSRSANFFLPGLLGILLLFVTTMLTAFSIVREKERGTLEQLFVTPVRPLGLMMGKIMPYFVMAFVEMVIILAFMRFAFQVPIHGNVLLLMLLASSFIFVSLAIGIMISTKATSQAEAIQMSMATILPSVFLSGYVFPRDTMPTIFYALSHLVPATYMMDISRGVILRGAGLYDLGASAAVLFTMGVVVLLLAAKRFTKMVV